MLSAEAGRSSAGARLAYHYLLRPAWASSDDKASAATSNGRCRQARAASARSVRSSTSRTLHSVGSALGKSQRIRCEGCMTATPARHAIWASPHSMCHKRRAQQRLRISSVVSSRALQASPCRKAGNSRRLLRCSCLSRQKVGTLSYLERAMSSLPTTQTWIRTLISVQRSVSASRVGSWLGTMGSSTPCP